MPYTTLKIPHFPSRMHAFVWRNWETATLEQMAATIETTPEKVHDIGLSMGLPPHKNPLPDYKNRGYLSIIRRNWHLLSYEQLLELLAWDSQKLDFTLRADDFLWVKLGGMKPTCPSLKYIEPSEAAKQRCAEIKKIVENHFADEFIKPFEERFEFINKISAVESPPASSHIFTKTDDKSIRFIYSYFAPYGDVLLNTELDLFPEGLLQRFSKVGINGIWLHVVLNQLAPSKTFPEFGKDHEIRLANLRKMAQTAKRYGIEIYLYINEPRAMPNEFFQNRENLRGIHYTAYDNNVYTMCTSNTEVRQWIADSLEYVFKQVQELGGVFTITASENISNCWSWLHGETCPRCSRRSPSEVISELNTTIANGVWKGNPDARVIVWDWGWQDKWVEPIIKNLPHDVYFMSVSEWDIPVECGGVADKITEYSISAAEPGSRAKKRWMLARKRGLKTMAKVQINTSWELSSLPYIPVMNLIAKHCYNLKNLEIDDLLLSWTLGGYPSPNLQLACEFSREPTPTVEQALRKVAVERYGSTAATEILQAWTLFSDAFFEYPYSRSFLYNGPMQNGPSNLLYVEPTGLKATMVGFPFDDIESWVDKYHPEAMIKQLEKLSDIWKDGLYIFSKTLSKTKNAKQKKYIEEDYKIAEAAYLYFKSAANQIKFTLARNKLTSDSTAPTDRNELIKNIKEATADELEIAKRHFRLTMEDSRFGFEASNHYNYLPIDLVEKVISCEYILKNWLPSLYGVNNRLNTPAKKSSVSWDRQ